MENDITVDLFSEIMKENNITVSQLSFLTNKPERTIYNQLSGVGSIHISLWSALYNETQDQRIANLITGEIPVAVVPIPDEETADFKGGTLKHLCQMRKSQLACENAVLDAISDGKIDENDYKAIMDLKKNHPESLKLQIQLFKTIVDQYERTQNI